MKRGIYGVLFLLLGFIPSVAKAAPFAYIPNSGGNTVSVIDTATDTVVSSITVGDNPMGVAINPAGTRLYVTNWGGVLQKEFHIT